MGKVAHTSHPHNRSSKVQAGAVECGIQAPYHSCISPELGKLVFKGRSWPGVGLQTEDLRDLGDSVLTTRGILEEGMLSRGQYCQSVQPSLFFRKKKNFKKSLKPEK